MSTVTFVDIITHPKKLNVIISYVIHTALECEYYMKSEKIMSQQLIQERAMCEMCGTTPLQKQ
jgi:hypothetical protein